MGQYFKLFNLDNSVEVRNSVRGKFGEFFFYSRMGEELLQALWRPNEGEKRVEVLPLNKAEGYVFPQESRENLSKVANEIIDMILSDLNDLSDLLSLMTSCQRFWEIGRHHLEKLVEDIFVVSWSGDRLICMGDYASLEDLPRGMLTDPEMERIIKVFDEFGDSYSLWDALPTIQAPRPILTSTTMTSTRRTKRDPLFDLRYGHGVFGDSWFAHRRYMNIRDAFNKLISIPNVDLKDFFDGYLVLRNLTTKEYVRGNVIGEIRDSPPAAKPWLKRMTFEHVLYIRTIWSSDSSLSCMYQGPLQIHRGIWAGHRFDVINIVNVVDKDGVAIEDWRDVTKEVIDEVMEIWEAEG